jgi:hypothetical protein
VVKLLFFIILLILFVSLFIFLLESKIGVLKPCQSQADCNSMLGYTCIKKWCSCPILSFFNGTQCCIHTIYYIYFIINFSSFSFLVNKLGFNNSCTSSFMCNDSIGLTCQNGKCVCPPNMNFDQKKCISH